MCPHFGGQFYEPGAEDMSPLKGCPYYFFRIIAIETGARLDDLDQLVAMYAYLPYLAVP